jgi:hypothetical protein
MSENQPPLIPWPPLLVKWVSREELEKIYPKKAAESETEPDDYCLDCGAPINGGHGGCQE